MGKLESVPTYASKSPFYPGTDLNVNILICKHSTLIIVIKMFVLIMSMMMEVLIMVMIF